MKIFLNGKEKSIAAHIRTLDDFVRVIVKNDKGKIVEWNGKVVKRSDMKSVVLDEGDRIELIQFMGGG